LTPKRGRPMLDPMTPLGVFVRARREQLGLNQAQAAEAWGLSSRSLLSEIEVGEIKNPRADTLIKIASGLGVTLDELLGQTNAKENGQRPAPGGKRRGTAIASTS